MKRTGTQAKFELVFGVTWFVGRSSRIAIKPAKMNMMRNLNVKFMYSEYKKSTNKHKHKSLTYLIHRGSISIVS